jgi:ascorbate-specific PTS system EIIC-type component UlaA
MKLMKRTSTTTFALLVSLFIPIALFFLAADRGANTGAIHEQNRRGRSDGFLRICRESLRFVA